MARSPDEWPILREHSYKSGLKVWLVDCGTARINDKPRRERYFYKLKKDAETKRDLLRVQRKNEGQSSFELSPAEREDARVALELLKGHAASLRQVARFYLDNLDVIRSQKHVLEVVQELLSAKQQDGRSDRYLRDIRVRLTAFGESFKDRLVHDIKSAELEDYLRSLQVGAVSRNNVKRLLGVLFAFAVKRRYALSNPAKETEKANVTTEKPGILTLTEAKSLLCVAPPEMLPALAIGLFAGLRPEAETWHLDWSNVDLSERLIDIGKSKNIASHRFVKISDNLAEWLKPYAVSTGRISPQKTVYFKRVREARAKAAKQLEDDGVNARNLRIWPSDCLRHTYASYHFGAFKNAHETAEQLGHGGSLTMFYRHYRNRVKESDAKAYWEIRPSVAAGS
jgi:integrase/recombinase XerD